MAAICSKISGSGISSSMHVRAHYDYIRLVDKIQEIVDGFDPMRLRTRKNLEDD